MNQYVPKYNSKKVFVDVKKPGFNYRRSAGRSTVNLAGIPKISPKQEQGRKLFWAVIGFFLIVTVFAGGTLVLGFTGAKKLLTASGEELRSNFESSVNLTREFKPNEAGVYLERNLEAFSEFEKLLGEGRSGFMLNLFGGILPFWEDGSGFVKNVSSLNVELLNFTVLLDELQQKGFGYFLSDGERLSRILDNLSESAVKITNQTGTVKNHTARLRNLSPFFEKLDDDIGDYYIKLSGELFQIERLINGVKGIISAEEQKHIVILFQNPSEIRPGGGFVGSYAHVTVQGGRMVSMDVRDIFDPDGQLADKIVPPRFLQTITANWGARDANWFFDFPTSAKTVLEFLERSKMYAEREISFDALIGVNINVLESILEIIGPVELNERELVITSENVMYEIRREIEDSKERGEEYPKKIIQLLTPIVLTRLQNVDSAGQTRLIEKLGRHIEVKDIMFFAKRNDLAGFLSAKGVDGSVYDLPSAFWGNYLAVVNANVAGGKSDAFVTQTIKGNVHIDTDGSILTDLTVQRRHDGDKETEPWWRAPNQNFIQIFTNPNATLLNIKGTSEKTLAKTNYGEDYEVHPELQKIESTIIYLTKMNTWTMRAHLKNVFGTWFVVPAGKVGRLDLRYQIPESAGAVQEGKNYYFIFERQSGVRSALDLTIFAPIGFKWKESGSSVFTYENPDPEGRVILTLTLTK